ncbi:MAG: gephyrin-like molybdotransferase Glp, partial [Myxococcota bacterium]
ATQRIQAALRPLGQEIVAIGDAHGRILATDIIATRRLPPWHNSAMDGFAVRAGEIPGGEPVVLPVTGTIAAGDTPDSQLAPGTVMRIMTGAPMPAGADAVVIREDVDDRGDSAVFAEPVQPGDNVRRAGEDVAIGDVVLSAGVRLGPGEVGIMAALGCATVPVGVRPRVAIMSTGDELVGVDVTPRSGQIVNSNAYALAAQIRECGGVPIPAGIAPDRKGPLSAMIAQGLQADVLLTSGGVSVGDFDFVKGAFAEAGVAMDFWKVAMKPGKPLAFGTTETGKPAFGLPGNPVSSMVVFELFVRPALLLMQGAQQTARPRLLVELTRPYAKRPGRAHYARARLSFDAGTIYAEPLRKQGSGMLSSMVAVDALVEVSRDMGDVAAGTQLPAIVLRPW